MNTSYTPTSESGSTLMSCFAPSEVFQHFFSSPSTFIPLLILNVKFLSIHACLDLTQHETKMKTSQEHQTGGKREKKNQISLMTTAKQIFCRQCIWIHGELRQGSTLGSVTHVNYYMLSLEFHNKNPCSQRRRSSNINP